jgi:hypothetical protein
MRSLFWIWGPMGFALGALSLAKLVGDFTQTDFVSIPLQIITAYDNFVSLIQRYAIEIPFGWTPPDAFRHWVVIWLVCGGATSRYLSLIDGERRIYSILVGFGLGPIMPLLSLLALLFFWVDVSGTVPVVLYIASLILMTLAAAAFLWWNASEIARLAG